MERGARNGDEADGGHLRVIAGIAKGHQLKAPPSLKTRPTSDLVRGAIFAMLENMAPDWSRVLDLYAGSGALGIEALSRGAGWADFVESAPAACRAIRENLAHTKLADRAKVYCANVEQILGALNEKYGIILLDPPYSDPTVERVLERIGASSLVGSDTTMVVEHSRRVPLSGPYGSLRAVKSRRHGDTEVTIFRQEE